VGFIEAKDVQASIMAPDLDVAVVRPVPLVERLENLDLMPAETESSGDRHSAIVRMLLYVNTHFLVPESFERTCRGMFRPARTVSFRYGSHRRPLD
jgi:hypothetical protein